MEQTFCHNQPGIFSQGKKEIWDAMNKKAYSTDLALQEMQKYMVHGLIPIVSLADQLADNKDFIRYSENKDHDVRLN